MGPLEGIKVVELGSIGPGPFCCMLLSDMGAEIVRVDRPEPGDLGLPSDPARNILNRNRRSVAIDLKKPAGVETVKRLVAQADVLVEGYRPGVTERLGLGPDDCLAVNPRLVYGRMTGWGQDGPLAKAAGHDINYIALVGALHAIGPRNGAPVPPLNLVGDFGGGALYLAFGIVCALLERGGSGRGQVVDAAMVDGAASLLASVYSAMARGVWRPGRGENVLDGGAPWYSVYETKDGRYVSVGAVEARFYRELLRRAGIDAGWEDRQHDRETWPQLRERLAAAFRSKTRDEWCEALEGVDVCFAPVLDPWEAPEHPHLRARGSFIESFGVVQPAPAPRFSRSTPKIGGAPPAPGEHTGQVLRDWRFSDPEIEALRRAGAIGGE
ncbi:MAG: CoA transferase [Burkholderiaceae bacterium]|nr:CoA transferase [Burkholderiaceae bacterium]